MFAALKRTFGVGRAKARSARAAEPAPGRLFDDEFQRKLETLALASRRVFAGRNRAERRSKKQGSGVEFADHRAYAPGDDFRFVDWNAYQRFGRLLVRLFEEEEDLSIHFLLDCSGSMGFGRARKFDQARRLLAALSYVGLANLDRISVVALGSDAPTELSPTRGKNRIFKVLRYLEGLSAGGHTDLTADLKTFVARNKRRGLAILVSDLYDPNGFESAINVLRYNRFEPQVLHVVEPPEMLLDSSAVVGDVNVYDCETGEEREVTLTDRLIEQIRSAHQDYELSIQRFCRRAHVPYFRVATDVPFDELVLSVLRRGGLLS